MSSSQAEKILKFWFGSLKDNQTLPEKRSSWFSKDDRFDHEIRSQFGDLLHQAKEGQFDPWLKTPREVLAYVILLDQFSRNIFRQDPRAFESDFMSKEATLYAIDKEYDQSLLLIERHFLYLPLMHSEDLNDQKKSMKVFQSLLQASTPELKSYFENVVVYAKRHYDIIQRFGRFPHRNAVLNRKSTPQEIEFLKEPHSSF